ncbi:MAG: hypothetical protein WDN09_00125 [bacterium]
MIHDDKSLKDSAGQADVAVKDKSLNVPNNKVNKLIAALFMVTDILDKDEPIRAKLRTLGMEVISDMYTAPSQAQEKIGQILSFLDIASMMGMLSEMNCNILKKEFINLNKNISESTLQGSSAWLEKFIAPPSAAGSDMQITKIPADPNPYQGQKTHVGVQKAGTLMKVLSGVNMSYKKPVMPSVQKDSHDNFDVLKKQRRDEIIKVIKNDKEAQARGGATITDIRTGAKAGALALGIVALLSCSEKTLQRELVSMVKDNVLNKAGEKRWSKYSLPR